MSVLSFSCPSTPFFLTPSVLLNDLLTVGVFGDFVTTVVCRRHRCRCGGGAASPCDLPIAVFDTSLCCVGDRHCCGRCVVAVFAVGVATQRKTGVVPGSPPANGRCQI